MSMSGIGNCEEARMRSSRREFIKRSARTTCALALAGPVLDGLVRRPAFAQRPRAAAAKEAMFYAKLDGKQVACGLCPHGCEVPEDERGTCGVRENRDGTLRTLVYDRLCTLHIDPIEKKPLYHYLPGTTALSIATAGCNMKCRFCQNWQISQVRPEEIRHTPATSAHLVDLAVRRRAPTIAYTYSEPIIFYEYVHDTAKLGRTRNVGSVIISNGFINEKPMRRLAKHLTAVKIDFKGFTDKFYREICGASLQPVLDSMKVIRSTGIHLEIVVLLIPTLNDGAEEIKKMCGWIVKNLGPDVPTHFSRFHPTYKMKNLPRTPVKTVERARDIALKEGVHYAYVGNVPLHPYGHTYCHSCKKKLINRVGYRVGEVLIRNGKCPKCGTKIPGIWSQKDALAFKPK